MLDQHHGAVALERGEQMRHLLRFRLAHAGHRFVEQQQLGLTGQRHGQFELAMLAVRESRCRNLHARAQADAGQELARRLDERGFADGGLPEAEAVALRGLHRHQHVLQRGEFAKDRGDLVRAREPGAGALFDGQGGDVAPVEMNRAFVRMQLAGQLGDQRALAGAVGADDGVQLAGGDVEAEVVGGQQAAVAFDQAVRTQETRALLPGRPKAKTVSLGGSKPAGRAVWAIPVFLDVVAAGEARLHVFDHTIQPAPRQQHRHDNERPEEDHPVLGQRLQTLFGEQHRSGAQQRPEEGAESAKHHHHDHFARGRPGHVGRRHEVREIGIEHAGQAADHGADDVGGELVAQRRKAQRAHAAVVLARAAHDHAKACLHQPAAGPQAQAQHDEGGVVEHRGVVEHDAAEAAARIDRQAVVAAILPEADGEEIEHLREGQRDHDEGDASGAQRKHARDQAHAGAQQ